MDIQFLKELNRTKKVVNDTNLLIDLLGISENELKEALRLLNNRNNKLYRLKEHIEVLLKHTKNQYFITFDFSDSCLNEFKQDSRYQKVKRTLHKLCEIYEGLYIANIDFSPTKNREHYHCILGLQDCVKYQDIFDIIYNQMNFKNYGCINIKELYSKDSKHLARYLNKLTYHAMKVDQNIIYSTGFKKWLIDRKYQRKYCDIKLSYQNMKNVKYLTNEEFMKMLEEMGC